MTGYPHIDKPWMKYYEGMDLTKEMPNTNMFDYIKTKNRNRLSLISQEFYGRKITYNEFFL